MKKSTWCVILLAAAGAVLAIVFTWNLLQSQREAERLCHKVRRDLVDLAREIGNEALLGKDEVIENGGFRVEDKPLSLPEGDTRELYMWLYKKSNVRLVGLMVDPDIVDAQSGTFRDCWGQELVYRFPPGRKGAMFELYSVGPNGVDEGGGGDDITCSSAADFASYSIAFKDGLVDVDWIWANIGHIKRDPDTGRVIGAPQVDKGGK